MKNKRLLVLLSLIVSSLVFVACESDDDEKMLAAQNCFNNLDDSIAIGLRPAAAAACIAKLGGLSNPDAQLIRCGLKFWEGGLDTTKIVTAFDTASGVPENQVESTLISSLSLTDTNLADEAYDYCYSAGAGGMIYIASMVKLGTYMQAAGGTTAANYPDQCLAGAPNACTSAANGQMLIDMSEIYCVGDAEEDEVCQALGAAINANPGDPYNTIVDFLNQINF